MAKSTSPGLSDTSFFAHCLVSIISVLDIQVSSVYFAEMQIYMQIQLSIDVQSFDPLVGEGPNIYIVACLGVS